MIHTKVDNHFVLLKSGRGGKGRVLNRVATGCNELAILCLFFGEKIPQDEAFREKIAGVEEGGEGREEGGRRKERGGGGKGNSSSRGLWK